MTNVSSFTCLDKQIQQNYSHLHAFSHSIDTHAINLINMTLDINYNCKGKYLSATESK